MTGAAASSEGLQAFPVLQGATHNTYQPLAWQALTELRDAVRKYGLGSAEVMQVLCYFNASLLMPFDIRSLAWALFPPVEYDFFEHKWIQLAVRAVERNRTLGQGDPRHMVNTNMLLGTGNCTRAEGQAGFEPLAQEQCQQTGMAALVQTLHLATLQQPFATIVQGIDEPFLCFAGWLTAAVEKQVSDRAARKLMLQSLARSNCNAVCKRIIEVLPGEPSMSDMVGACAKFGKRNAEREGETRADTNVSASAPTNGDVLSRLAASTRGSAGVDVCTAESVVIDSDKIHKVPLDAFGPLGDGMSAFLMGRSSATIQGIMVHLGLIDADFSGQIHAMVSTPTSPLTIPEGTQIAQIVPFKSSVSRTEDWSQGDGSFGSTGPPQVRWTAVLTKDRPETLCTVSMPGATPSEIHLHGLLDTGADVSILSLAAWPPQWPLSLAKTSIAGLGGMKQCYVSQNPMAITNPEGQTAIIWPHVTEIAQNLWGDTDLKSPRELTPEAQKVLEEVQQAISACQVYRIEPSIDVTVFITTPDLHPTGQITYHLPSHKLLQVAKNTQFPLRPKNSQEPVQGPTIFTDHSGKTGKAIVTWQDGPEWQVLESHEDVSAQLVELRAAVIAFEKFSQEPFNLITNSAYVADITQRLGYSVLKEVSSPALFDLLNALWCAIQARVHPYYVLHVQSHTNLPGFVAEGNTRADKLANPAWIAPEPDVLAQAKASHGFFHQNAHTLQKQFQLTATEAREIVESCNDCHALGAPLPAGVNPRGLKALELWQTDVTQVAEFGRLKYVHVTVDTFSSAMWASAHTGEKARIVIAHWRQAIAVLGIPSAVKTDNGPACASQQVRQFLQSWLRTVSNSLERRYWDTLATFKVLTCDRRGRIQLTGKVEAVTNLKVIKWMNPPVITWLIPPQGQIQ
ncbi:hypothetical protein DUI87_03891 [Hirundo rustica rustica]|uniref:RNA-directed DNA polymerase n=1 Tax=Hirundo rustica rustica TaxID=333673 RepID=A0A3M0L5T3_HIRRU|nr:hypothetical protein DUI87_03891 [Hirundo rustica rustica]